VVGRAGAAGRAQRYPTIPVVVCTADGRKEDVVFALRHGCMDWVDKPATKQTIGDALKRVARETRRQVSAGVASPPPARPAVSSRRSSGASKMAPSRCPRCRACWTSCSALLANLNVSPEEVLRVLEKDPAIAAKILATANTATYGGRGRITDLKSAVTRLGNRTISSIAQTAALRGMFSFKLPAFRAVFQKMWTGHCVAAYLARELAMEVADPDPEEVYLISLLHNSGEQFMLRVFAEIFQRQANQVLSMEEVLGAMRDTHTVFGASLATKWNMGPQFELVARHHHDAAFDKPEFDTRTRRILHICNVADRLVDDKGLGFYTESLPGPDIGASYDVLRISDGRKPYFAERVEVIRADVSPITG
jgi:HD-like signal output (HDOD) protein